MCFIAPSTTCRHIATEDIVVYKVVRKLKYKRKFWKPWVKYLESVQSVVQDFTYKIYQHNKPITLNPRIILGILNINEGYHSYVTLNDAAYNYPSTFSGHYHIIKCIIPKGRMYYKYDWHCVSSNIIITDEVCIE